MAVVFSVLRRDGLNLNAFIKRRFSASKLFFKLIVKTYTKINKSVQINAGQVKGASFGLSSCFG